VLFRSVGELTIGANGEVVNDMRRNVTAALSVPKSDLDDEKVTGLPYNTVPVAIKNAVKAYAAAGEIRSVMLVNDQDGKPVYEVVYYRDGRRDRMIVAKDGTLRRIERNVPAAAELPELNKHPVLAIGDLPQPVQDTIQRQTQNGVVKQIGPMKVGDNTVYQVRYEINGSPFELLVANDGAVVLPEGQERPSSNATLTARAPDHESTARVENTGAAGAAERGTVKSAPNLMSDAAPAKVNLADVPPQVQSTAKQVAGSGTVESITPKLSDAGVAYEISYTQNGVQGSVLVNKDGVVVKQ